MLSLFVRTVLIAGFLANTSGAQSLNVATDIAPVHSLVSAVMGELGEPELLVPANVSPHHHSLRPSQAKALSQADALFWVSDDLTPWIERVQDVLAPDAVKVELLHAANATVWPQRDSANFSDHNHEEEHSHHDEEDPHAWLDPDNAKIWLTDIARTLAGLDPENAAIYTNNALLAAEKIDTLTGKISDGLALKNARKFVVFHDGYQYFERRFGLSATGAISLSDASDPSPARIAEIRGQIQTGGVVCVFSEAQFNADLVSTVIEGSDVKTAVLDSVGAGIEPGANLYFEVLENLTEQFLDCL